MTIQEDDTIAAIATPPGEGGVGIVRLSGPMAFPIAQRVFRRRRTRQEKRDERAGGGESKDLATGGRGGGVPSEGIEGFRPWCVNLGWIVDPHEAQVLDEVLLWVMKAPHSYTREDVVEISCHGGAAPLRAVLGLVLREGARLAEPGEFTRRAFINGRIDLSRAEAVLDTIRARSDAALSVAVGQLGGTVMRRVDDIYESLVEILARIEAQVDFPDEELGEDTRAVYCDIGRVAKRAVEDICTLLDTAETGMVLRQGIRVVITGKPNVGKSSLLNAILGFERAIVTDIPGTTRDAIEEAVFIGGAEVVLTDTAGLRGDADRLEAMGMEHTRRALAKGDIALVVLDDTTGLQEEDFGILKLTENTDRILVINKIDLGVGTLDDDNVRKLAGSSAIVRISALKGINLTELKESINAVARAKIESGLGKRFPEVMITKERHAACLKDAKIALIDCLAVIDASLPMDMATVDIRTALSALGQITGREAVDEAVIDRIFSEFCLGK
jgi:tRNA modification GTPase